MPVRPDLLLSFYGDDFTGSTDALEALTRAGVRTVLFLEPPEEIPEAFADVQAVGLAGTSRAMTPAEMDAALPPIYARLKGLGAPAAHYKTCSTFDSAPEIGSIGRALDLGDAVFGAAFVPLLVGAPRLGRYCAFGNLFARSGPESPVYRLDRHPSMSRHPITPMRESDLRRHLAEQTTKPVALFDVRRYDAPAAEVEARFARLLDDEPEVVLLDAVYDAHMEAAGRLIWSRASHEHPLFIVGSSGVEYALAAHWRAAGLLPEPPVFDALAGVGQIVVVSGSCSPVTQAQIIDAVRSGFAEVALATDRLADPNRREATRAEAERQALEALGAGLSVVLHTCRGPDDPRLAATKRQFERQGVVGDAVRHRTAALLGGQLGKALRRLLTGAGIRRAVVAGGDTSGYVAAELGITAVEMTAPLAPGTPLCRAYAPDTDLHGLEIAFKGGQVGTVDFFDRVLRGATPGSERL